MVQFFDESYSVNEGEDVVNVNVVIFPPVDESVQVMLRLESDSAIGE